MTKRWRLFKRRKRMKIETLLVTTKDETGKYIDVQDWIDMTVQIAASSKGEPFSGTVTIEGTLDGDPNTEKWSPLLIIKSETVLNLSGNSLAGLRASTSGMAAGEVTVLASGR